MTHTINKLNEVQGLLYDIRQRINPAYADQRGTESYERRECAEAIEWCLVRISEFDDKIARQEYLLREQLTISRYLSKSICMTDETGAGTNPDNIVESSIEAIEKELGK